MCDAERTIDMPANSDGAFVTSALEDFHNMHAVTIINEVDELLIKSWVIRFDSFDGIPKLLCAESQMKWISDWSISVISDCPTASKGTDLKIKSQAGRQGDDPE